MMDLPDRKLLERYLADRDEAAFGTLLDRHLTLVHGVARRVTGSEDLGRDIAQATFLRLARRAALIPASVSLPAWLHRTAHSLAADLVRGEVRRKKRERLVATFDMDPNDDSSRDVNWDALAPVIDRLVDALPGADREILLARFYRNESHAAIASRLGLSEALARKRSSRALEKLRGMLGKRGIATSSSALAALLPVHAASLPAPVALTGSILQVAQGITPLLPRGVQVAFFLMNATQKILIATAAMVFFASLGYAVRPQETAGKSRALASSTAPVPSAISGTGNGPAPARTAQHLPETADGRRKRLDQILGLSSAAARRREMLAFVELLQPGQFLELCAPFSPSFVPPDPLRTDLKAESAILMAAWARQDLEGALATLKNPLFFLGDRLGKAIGAAHPERVMQWCEEMPDRKEYFLAGLGRVDLPAAMGAIHDLPENRRGPMLHSLYVEMDEEPGLLPRMVAMLEPGPDRSYLLRRVTDFAASADPAGSLAALRADPESFQQCDLEAVFRTYGYKETEGALAALDEIPEGAARSNAVGGLAQGLASRDPEAAYALLDRYPEAATDATISTIASYGMSHHHENVVMENLHRFSDPETRDLRQASYLRAWRDASPTDAQAWIDAHVQELPTGLLQSLDSPKDSPGKNPVLFLPLPGTP